MTPAKWLVFAGLLIISSLLNAAEKVVVLTSYPQEVVSQFEAAFEQKYPQYRLEILWRQSRDAMSYLQQKHAPIDVYWTPAQRNFATLANEGAFRKLDIDLTGLPNKIGGFQISDPDGYYLATEVAGFGMAYHPDKIKSLGVPELQDWSDLINPAFRGQVMLPIPSKVGYAPMLVDTLLQSNGWEQGWHVLRQIAANATLADAGATFISDDVGSGRVAAGVTIDFFAVSAIANGKPLKFTYPEKVGYSPAHIAIFAEATQLEGARAFASFVLSEQGQAILFHPDIRKLPVRPSAYVNKPAGYFDPFVVTQRASYAYNMTVGLARQEMVSALFDALITRHHQTLKSMWETIHQAERQSPADARLVEARRLANWLPISAEAANDTKLWQIFSQKNSPTDEVTQKWDIAINEHYVQATKIAQQVLNK